MAEKRPVIGITPQYDRKAPSYWMRPAYMTSLERAGALPIMLPLTRDGDELSALLDLCDGIIISGGPDVAPELYGGELPPKPESLSPERDGMETAVFRLALERDMPVLGICRGIQLMNVCLGGTLWQDLDSQVGGGVKHWMDLPLNRYEHTVTVLPNTPLADIAGAGEIRVNSHHHQAVRDVAPSLAPMARAADGVVEAAYMPGRKFVLGVQWHPELIYDLDDAQRGIFRALAEASRRQ